MPTAFRHKNIRLPTEHYKGKRFYFITMCFDQRRRYASNPALARWLLEKLRMHAAASGFWIHAYTLMPDHLHFLAEGTAANSDLLEFVTAYKKATGYYFERKKRQRLWQFKFYDHTLRNHSSVEAVCWYIWMNPVRKGICLAPTQYEFSGSFTGLGTALLKTAAISGWIPPWKTGCNLAGLKTSAS